jgi:hypothetical protein
MEDDFTPPTQPDGAQMPPPKIPITAIATATPPPPPNRNAWERTPLMRSNTLQRAIERTLDAVDEFADVVAAGLGLRHR